METAASAAIWTAAATHADLSNAHSRAAVAKHYRGRFIFCCDSTANSRVDQGGTRIILNLGSAGPRRVAAAHSLLSVDHYRQLDFVVRELTHANNHHVVLWLGIMYSKHDSNDGLSRHLDHTTIDEALGGYHVAPQTTMSERFARGRWSMNAIGSSGAVWSDGSVVRIIARRFVAGDTVSLLLDARKRQMRVRVTSAKGVATEHVAVNRLLRTSTGFWTEQARMHAIVHLTDVAVPAVGRQATAVVDVVGAC